METHTEALAVGPQWRETVSCRSSDSVVWGAKVYSAAELLTQEKDRWPPRFARIDRPVFSSVVGKREILLPTFAARTKQLVLQRAFVRTFVAH